jgi:hypothetical protein
VLLQCCKFASSNNKDAGHLRSSLPVRLVACYYCDVKGWVDLLLGVMAAAAAALLLALIARDDIGMPPGMIREDALIAAGVMVAVVTGLSWRKPRKPKQKL